MTMSQIQQTNRNIPINMLHRKKRLLFRAWRRGFKEADLIMGRFAQACLESLDDQELEEFEHLLNQPDTEVYGWICGTLPTPPNFDGPVLRQLKSFRFYTNASSGDGPSV